MWSSVSGRETLENLAPDAHALVLLSPLAEGRVVAQATMHSNTFHLLVPGARNVSSTIAPLALRSPSATERNDDALGENCAA